MDGLQEPSRAPITLFNLNSKQDITQFATGCDADVGGLSTVNLDLETSSTVNGPIGKPATARFWGDMKVGVRPEVQGRVRGGYAGFRNKVMSKFDDPFRF
jgi:NADH dehydrogenase [ubiquinone] 1 alpha subcomplex assembly factor 1